MKRILSFAALCVAISLTAAQSFALDVAQTKRIKKAITSATLPEMPGVVATLITQASKTDREEVAVTAVQAAIYKSPSSAPMVVAAVAKAAPDLSEVVLKKAIQLEPTQLASDRGNSGRGGVVVPVSGGNGGQGNGNGRGHGNANRGGGTVTGHFAPGDHNPGPPLPDAPPHHNRPPHPLGGPPGLIDYSKPRPHH